jgi:hypothetical protein
VRKSGKLACHVVNSNIAIGSLPTLQISLGIVALFEKIYDGEPILTVFSNIGEDYNTVVAMYCRVLCEKCAAARHIAAIWKQ